jgi:hypothetical protein
MTSSPGLKRKLARTSSPGVRYDHERLAREMRAEKLPDDVPRNERDTRAEPRERDPAAGAARARGRAPGMAPLAAVGSPGRTDDRWVP